MPAGAVPVAGGEDGGGVMRYVLTALALGLAWALIHAAVTWVFQGEVKITILAALTAFAFGAVGYLVGVSRWTLWPA